MHVCAGYCCNLASTADVKMYSTQQTRVGPNQFPCMETHSRPVGSVEHTVLGPGASSCALTGQAHTSQCTSHHATDSSHSSNNKQLPPPHTHCSNQFTPLSTPTVLWWTSLSKPALARQGPPLTTQWQAREPYLLPTGLRTTPLPHPQTQLLVDRLCVLEEREGHMWSIERKGPPPAGCAGEVSGGEHWQLHTDRGKQSWLEASDMEVRGGEGTAGYQLTCINLADSQSQ